MHIVKSLTWPVEHVARVTAGARREDAGGTSRYGDDKTRRKGDGKRLEVLQTNENGKTFTICADENKHVVATFYEHITYATMEGGHAPTGVSGVRFESSVLAREIQIRTLGPKHGLFK